MANTASKRERVPLPARSNPTLDPAASPQAALHGTSARTVTENEIRLRAYQFYLERGETPGDEIADWVRAEQELLRR